MKDRLIKLHKSIDSLESNIIYNQNNVKKSIIQTTQILDDVVLYFNEKYSGIKDEIGSILSELSSYITRVGCSYSSPISHDDLDLLSEIRLRIFSIKRKINQYEKKEGEETIHEWFPPVLPF